MSFKNETFPISLLLPEQACGQFVFFVRDSHLKGKLMDNSWSVKCRRKGKNIVQAGDIRKGRVISN